MFYDWSYKAIYKLKKNEFGNLLNVNLMHNIKKNCFKFDLNNHIWLTYFNFVYVVQEIE